MKIKSVKVERNVLLCCLQTEDKRTQQYILAQTTVEDFATPYGQQIRKLLESYIVNSKPIPKVDTFVETPALAKDSVQFISAPEELLEKAERVSFKQAVALVDTLKNIRKSRNLLNSIQTIGDRCKDDVSELTLAEAEKLLEQSLREIRDKGFKENKSVFGADSDTKKLVRDATTPEEGEIIPTGLNGLDMQIKGFKRGDLVVVSASRGGAKSALTMQMAWAQFKAGCNVGYVSLEMPRDQIESRLVAHITGHYYSAVRLKFRDLSAEERKNIRKRMYAKLQQEIIKTGQEKNCKLVLYDRRAGRYTPFQMEMELSMEDIKFDVVYIDYLSLLKTSATEKKERYEEQIEMSAFLKGMAAQLDCVVVLLTQLNDDGHVKYGRGPEEAADWWLHWSYGERERQTGNVDIYLGKARHGETCKIPAKFNLSVMRVDTYAPEKAVPQEAATEANSWDAGDL